MFDIIDAPSERIYVFKSNNMSENLRVFEDNLNEFIKSDNRDMVIDLEGQDVMSSRLLALLIRVKRGLSDNKRDLIIKNCNEHIYRCFEMAGLDSYFTF